MKKLKWWHILLIIVAVIIIIAAVGNNSSSKQDSAVKSTSSSTVKSTSSAAKEKDAEKPKASVIKITSKDLIKAYDDNEVKADKKYKDKQLKITGEITDIGKDITDTPYITLGNGDEFAAISVQCCFSDDQQIKKVGNLKKGETVTVTGTCDGQSLNIVVNDCTLK